MKLTSRFTELAAADVHDDATQRKEQGWRYVQMLAVNNDNTVDLVYSYMLNGDLENLVISDLQKDAHLPSITDLFLEAFVCENEIHDLFGITFDGLAIDFLGNFYKLANETPMTIISPAQLAAREKAAKAAAAKTAKTNADTAEDDMEAKLANMDPEKAAKVRAAMEAKAKKEAAQKQADMEAKLADMDPEKAAKVRAAMEAKAKKEAASAKEGE